jgi:hypothetical protein
MKVYCKKCKWLATNYYAGIPGTDKYLCTCPLIVIEKDTPLEVIKEYGNYKEINANNDCKWYTEKPKTFMEKLKDEYSGV